MWDVLRGSRVGRGVMDEHLDVYITVRDGGEDGARIGQENWGGGRRGKGAKGVEAKTGK